MIKTILVLFLLTINLFSQVVETEGDNFFKIYSSDIKFSKDYTNIRKFIKEIDLNLLTYIKDDKLEKKVFDFYYNGNFRGIRYLSNYLKTKISSKALALTKKDKLKICNIIKKYDEDNPDGDNCIGDLEYQNSKILFWNYLPSYLKAYSKYILQGENLDIFFYTTIYFLAAFILVIIFISFIKSSGLFLKDMYSLVFTKRPHYESFFWAVSIFTLMFYMFSFNTLTSLLFIITISFVYLNKKFIPLYIIIILIPFLFDFLSKEYQNYNVKLTPIDRLAFEVIHTDLFPTNKQLNTLKDENTLFSNIAIASIYKKEGDFKASLRYYEAALKIKKVGFIYNNIANIYALKGDSKKAIDSYNEAKYYNDDVIYFYNMSKLYYRLKDNERAEYYRKLSTNLSKEDVNKFDKISTFNINRFFLDKFPDYNDYLKLYVEVSNDKNQDSYLNLFKLNYKRYLIYLSISILFFLLLLFTLRKKLKASYCQRCGTIFNSLEIAQKHGSFELCVTCYSMMNTRSSLKKDDLIKKEKEIRIKKMIKRYRDLVINLFLPGSFLFYKYNSYLGVFTTLWHTYYVVVVLMFYSKWHQVVNGNLFDFSMILFTLIELFFYIYTYFIMIKRR